MAKRRVWSSLSPAYQARLSRAGITQTSYESGVSLRKARGHSETPEHPEEAIRQPSKYQRYRQNVASLQHQVWDRKQRLFDTSYKWHEQRAKENVFRKVPKPEENMPVLGARAMRKMLAASDDEWYANVSVKSFTRGTLSDDWNALFYH